MEAFTRMSGIVAPIDRANIDTDAIIPKQYLKSIKRSGFGPNLFDDWRYLDPGEPGQDVATRRPHPDFVLNRPPYDRASILLARENFGCGSSREHAVWALLDFGIRVVIAPSFADIFYNNSFKNGLLPITLEPERVEQLFGAVETQPGYSLTVDLQEQVIETPEGEHLGFEVEGFRRHRLLHGLDDIAITLEYADDIRVYEQRRRIEAPWLFSDITAEAESR
jgi:3-isopropylmalate/(R)-2-methylmalate dehydratase small subunit